MSHVQLFLTSLSVAHHAPLSMELSPYTADFPNPGIRPKSSSLQGDFFTN